MKHLLLIVFLLSCSTLDASTPKILNRSFRKEMQRKLKRNHKPLSYKEARKKLFGHIHLEGTNPGNFVVRDIYCTNDYTTTDFPRDKTIGPNRIPDHRVINTEHVWPQSRFNTGGPAGEKEYKVSDLHILYPSSSRMNSARLNHAYGEPTTDIKKYRCSSAKKGKFRGVTVFEPPRESKGNVARAMFYFAVRYNMKINNNMEKFLRRWHREDPVDRLEKRRSQLIKRYQGNSNPFIENPRLITKIKDF